MTAQPYLAPDDCHCNASMGQDHARGCPQWKPYCGETQAVTAGAGAYETATCWLPAAHSGGHVYMVERPEAQPIDIDPRPDEDLGPWLARAIETINPSDFATASLNRDRPYNGQPHTDEGTRGSTLVAGLTMRDIKDCFVIGAFRATGKPMEEYPRNVYGIDWNDLDPMAVCQNMLCAIEERMGIYPNVPRALLDEIGGDS